MSKSGKQFLKPGFLANQKQTDYEKKRNKKVKTSDRRLKDTGFKHNTTSFRGSVHSNGNGKRIRADKGHRADVEDRDYNPSDGEDDGEDDNDDDSVDSFEEALELPEKQPRISDIQRTPSRNQHEAIPIADKVTRSTPNPDAVTEPPLTLDAEPQIEPAPVVKRGRGVARGFEVKRRFKTGGKIKGVIFDEDKWLPVGPAEKIFKMEIGILTRLLAPLHVFYWKRVTAAQKAPLFERLESEFDVKFEDPHTRTVVDKIMAMRFRQFKHRCHLHYKKFSPEEAPQHPPVNVEPVDWIPLCEHFKTDEFKKQSKAGTENRGELEVNHTSGSKSFIQRLYEMENSESGEDLVTREEPSQLNLYKVTHLKKDGTWVHPQAAENHKNMEILKNQPLQEGGNKKTEDEVREDVLKTKIGYARGLGYGVKPSKSTSRGASA
ncbi:hypothetical protein RHMOL_Rhmol05G0152000 [Rhododendron molle]|uniref:Uncharacterized protein n=1 Tax=Rhododendron molle TaxID=49168 RepID=A0ACC0NQC0_RHOML|nr:hypothetical protein RHMOL_Rhmol05G0152000 [Rhododendron molle]